MELFGLSLSQIYLIVLLVAGAITLIYILFGDVLEGIGEGVPFLNPTIILFFLIFLSAIVMLV